MVNDNIKRVYLSELDNESELLVTYKNIQQFMTKEQLLDTEMIHEDSIKLYLAEEEAMTFDLFDIISSIGEDAYEDWNLNVYEDLKNCPETLAFLDKVQEVFNKNKVYTEGTKVIID